MQKIDTLSDPADAFERFFLPNFIFGGYRKKIHVHTPRDWLCLPAKAAIMKNTGGCIL